MIGEKIPYGQTLTQSANCRATSGGSPLTLAGTNFGTASYSPTTTLVGVLEAEAMTEWVSDTSLVRAHQPSS